MDVFSRDLVKVVRVALASLKYFRESGLDLICFSCAEHSGADQAIAMGNARADVGCEESPVETERPIELGESRVDRIFESASPKIVLLLIAHLVFRGGILS